MNMNGITAGMSKVDVKAQIKAAKPEKMSAEERKALVSDLKAQQAKQDNFFLTNMNASMPNTYSKPIPAAALTPAKTSSADNKDQLGVSGVKLPALAQQKLNEFNNLITSMFGTQDNMYAMAQGKIDFSKFTTEDIEKAKKSLEPGGEFSVDAVATRIMDMAKALSGGDESKIALLRGAVAKGFAAAGVVVGGTKKLPDICHDTFDEVMSRFDKWEGIDNKTEDKSDKTTEAAEK